MNRKYLDPKQPLNIEPAADRNVERITDCCLDAAPKMSFFLGKGRVGGAWWMIWMGMMVIVLGAITSFMDGNIKTGIPAFLGIVAICVTGFGLSLLFPIHIWKTHYPIRFSRKSRKVYCHWSGKTYIEDWDTIKAYIQIKTDFNAMGAPSQTPQINIEFHNDDGSVAEHSVIGLTGFGTGHTIDEQAEATWEYIRHYMEEGPEQLPEPDLRTYKPLAFKDLIKVHSPFPIIKNKEDPAWFIDIFINFPFYLLWFPIAYPTEVIYYFLDKHVHMKPFPPEMDEPCRCENEVVIWEPSQHLEKRHEEAA
jgi:hypothetical protein